MSSVAARRAAIAAMAAAKKSGVRPSTRYEVEDKSAFEDVDEETYKEIVAKRRRENDFVVDDEGLGYGDDGEEHFSEEEAEEDDLDLDEGGGGGAAGGAAKPKRPVKLVAGTGAAGGPVGGLKTMDFGVLGASEGAGSGAAAFFKGAAKDVKLMDDGEELNLSDEEEAPVSISLGRSGLNPFAMGGMPSRAPPTAAPTYAPIDYSALDARLAASSAAAGGRGMQDEDLEDDLAALGGGTSPLGWAATSTRRSLYSSPTMMVRPGEEMRDLDAGQVPSPIPLGVAMMGDAGAAEEAVVAAAAPARTGRLLGRATAAKPAAPGASGSAPGVVTAVAPAAGGARPAVLGASGGNGATGWNSGWIAGDEEAAAAAAAAAAAVPAPARGKAAAAPVAPAPGMPPRGPLPIEKVPLPAHMHSQRRAEVQNAAAAGATYTVDSVLFYWLDAYEARNRPGTVCLLGKVMLNAGEYMAAKRAEQATKEAAAAAAAAAVAAGQKPAQAPQVKLPQPVYASACVTVHNMQRCMFALPRRSNRRTGAPVESVKAVQDEVNKSIRDYLASAPAGPAAAAAPRVVRCKPVTRSYAFELADVPREATEFVKVLYDARLPQLPPDFSGDTFSRVFGTNTTSLEHLLLKRDLMGPCWLRLFDVKPLTDGPISWCQYDIGVSSPKLIMKYGAPTPGAKPGAAAAPVPGSGVPLPCDAAKLPTPELVTTTLSTRTILDERTLKQEIVAMSLLTHRTVSADGPTEDADSLLTCRTFIRERSGTSPLPVDLRSAINKLPPHIARSIVVLKTEKDLLNAVLATLVSADPDVLIGHNVLGFDLDMLLHRCEALKVPEWSRVGRIRREAFPSKGAGSGGRAAYTGILAAGRLVCDTYLAAQELIRRDTYTLTSLAFSELGGIKRIEIEPGAVATMLVRSAADVLALCRHTQEDARLALKLCFKLQVLPLTKQLTNLSGNLWSRSLRGARAERIEYLLLHEFHRLKYVVPDKAGFSDGPAAAAKKSKAAEAAEAEAPEDDAIMDAPGGDDDEDDDGEGGARKAKAPKAAAAGGAGGNKRVLAAGQKPKRGKPLYTGGLVLEPKKGLYDKFVLLLDFQSLYPSIIQEYNLCFTTVERAPPRGKGGAAAAEGDPADEEANGGYGGDGRVGGTNASGESFQMPALPDLSKNSDLAPLPRLIRDLVLKRRQVKREMGNESSPALKQALDIRQQALKILANSMYGCLGFSSSRFYAAPIAALVTAQGRALLQSTIELATNTAGCEVIYGDTDSMFLLTSSTDLKEVRAIGNKVKGEVKKLYKYLELEIDGIFSHLLLLKKKKYAAREIIEGPGGSVTTAIELKGLDLVRRDWCQLSRDVGRSIVEIILKPIDPAVAATGRAEAAEVITDMLTKLGKDMREGRVDVRSYVIRRGLNKPPGDYPDAKSQPHLQVALQLIKQGKRVSPGEVIEFVVCNEPVGSLDAPAAGAGGEGSPAAEGGAAVGAEAAAAAAPPVAPKPASGNVPAAMRAYHPEEVVKSGGKLTIDVEWYLTQQVLPPLARLCDPIPGLEQARLAVCLGLDPSRFGGNRSSGARGVDDDSFRPHYIMSDEDRFKGCAPLMTACLKCCHMRPFNGPYTVVEVSPTQVVYRSGFECPEPGCTGGILMPISKQAADAGEGSPMFTAAVTVPAGVPVFEVVRMRLVNLVAAGIRAAISAHYNVGGGLLQCDEAACGLRTRAMSVRRGGMACLRPRCKGRMHPIASPADLHLQLEYYAWACGWAKARVAKLAAVASQTPRPVVLGLDLPPAHREALDAGLEEVVSFLTSSAYHYVDLSKVFTYVRDCNASAGLDTKALGQATGLASILGRGNTITSAALGLGLAAAKPKTAGGVVAAAGGGFTAMMNDE